MSDWQKGDLALCIKQGPWLDNNGNLHTDGPRSGEVCRVIAVLTLDGELGLALCEHPFDLFGCFTARRFRKITPGAKIEGIEEPRRLPVKARADA